MARETSLLAMVTQADPEHSRDKRYAVEYEFTASGRATDERTHADGMRVFRGNYDVRGPYAPSDSVSGGITWNGQQLIWSGDSLSWDED